MQSELTVEQARDIASRIIYRQKLIDESLEQSILIVILNYGDHLTTVKCVGNERWEGQKKDITSPAGKLPKCPSNHPLMEFNRVRLGLVGYDLG